MSHKLLAVMLAGALTPVTLGAQHWTPPRTPDGQPDMQGMWTNATITPFERPRALADKPFLTEKEAAALEQQAAERRATARISLELISGPADCTES